MVGKPKPNRTAPGPCQVQEWGTNEENKNCTKKWHVMCRINLKLTFDIIPWTITAYRTTKAYRLL